MNLILFVLSGILLALAIFCILCAVLGISTQKRARVVRGILYAKPKSNQSFFTGLTQRLAVPLSNVLPFSPYRLEKMQQILTSANIMLPARVYLSRCVVSAGILCLVALLASLVIKPMFIVALFLPIFLYIRETKKAEDLTLQHKSAIEQALPQLVATIETELESNRDVYRILKNFIPNTSTAMRAELSITVADMTSGNYETALLRMESRVNSTLVSNVMRGLIGVVRGKDEIAYFKMLNYDLKQFQLMNLKKAAQKCIPKLTVCAIVLLIGILALYGGVLAIDALQSAAAFF